MTGHTKMTVIIGGANTAWLRVCSIRCLTLFVQLTTCKHVLFWRRFVVARPVSDFLCFVFTSALFVAL